LGRSRTALLAFLLGVALAPCAAADDAVEAALALAKAADDNPDLVVQALTPVVASGDRRVEEQLASAYFLRAVNGIAVGGVTAEAIAPALDFARRALGHGSGEAANLLYTIYSQGQGVPVDDVRAAEYLRQADALGNEGGKLNYAIALYDGSLSTVPRDLDDACPRLLALFDHSSVEAIAAYYVGLMLFKGECGKRVDKAMAVEGFRIAAESGWRDAERDYAKALEFGWAGERDLEKALHWYGIAARHGDPHALWRVGMTYVEGEGHAPDPAEAVRWFQRAADAGGINGHASLATMYATGEGVAQDFAKARALYGIAAEAGDAHSFHELAIMQIHGEGQVVDAVAARVSYLQSLELGGREDPGLQTKIDAALDDTKRGEADARFETWKRGRGGGEP
jgi:TPR repeat protein